ncbi:MAG: MFS transporter [Acidimicrobiales bacterium]
MSPLTLLSSIAPTRHRRPPVAGGRAGVDRVTIPRAGPPHRWVVFGVVSIALFMSALDSTIVATGLPAIRHALHTRLNWASWTMTAYQLGLVTAMPVAGRVADIHGRKRVFVIAATLFTTASLLCGLVDNIGLLLVLRVAQAAGGAAFVPSASGMVVDAFGRDRNRALGLFSSVFPLGALAGPIAGGVILATWSWRGLFLVNVPVGLLFTVLAVRYLPASPRRDRRADLVGAVLMGATVLSLMLAVTDAGNRGAGLSSPSVLLPAGGAVALGWTWLRRSAHMPDPVIPVRLLRGRPFAAMNTVNATWGACVIGLGALVPLIAEQRYGLSPLRAGTLLTTRALSEIGVAVLASLLIHRTGFRPPMLVGFALVSGGLILIAIPPVGMGAYPWLMLGATLTGLGTGASAPAANNASLELAPDDVGAVTGLRAALRQGGAIVALAVTTALAARGTHETRTVMDAFLVVAVLLLLVAPLVFAVPDNGRRLRREARDGG